MKYDHCIIGFVVIFFFSACREEGRDLNKKKGTDTVEESSGMNSAKKIDLLQYLVKTEKMKTKDVYFKLESAYLHKRGKNGERSIAVSLKGNPKTVDAYYLFISIYPLDEELDLLEKERRKYGFEAYSARLGEDGKKGLFASRTISTQLNFARAITISVLDYETKRKSMEVVFKNVNI